VICAIYFVFVPLVWISPCLLYVSHALPLPTQHHKTRQQIHNQAINRQEGAHIGEEVTKFTTKFFLGFFFVLLLFLLYLCLFDERFQGVSEPEDEVEL